MQNLFYPKKLFALSEFSHKALFENCLYPWEALANLNNYLNNHKLGVIKGHISPSAHLENKELISIGEGTIVEPGAYIQGPCIIGRQCTIRHGAYIRGFVLTGDSCVIGHATEIKQSILINKAHAAHFAYVGNSILGSNVNLGAGVKLANLKFNQGLVSFLLEDQRIDTGLRKLGAILGDNVQLGCNCVTNPGTLMSKGSFAYPCTNFGGYVPESCSVVSNKNNEIKHIEDLSYYDIRK